MRAEDSFKRYKRYYTYITPLLKGKAVKSYTYLILTFFTAAFFAYSAIKPTVKTIVNLRRQVVDGRYTDSKLQEKINSLSSGQEIISKIAIDYPVIEAALPKKPTLDLLVKQLENLASASFVSFNFLSFQGLPLRKNSPEPAIESKTNLKEISFNFAVKGSYENLILFLENSRRLRRLLTIEDIQISPARAEENLLTLSVQAKAFYQD